MCGRESRLSKALALCVACGVVAAAGCGGDGATKDAGVAGAAATARDAEPAADGGITAHAAATIGSACSGDSDCARGRCAETLMRRRATSADPAPGGYCTQACTSQASCGSDAACVNIQLGGDGYCAKTCESIDACRDGYRCISSTGAVVAGSNVSGTCQPAPQTDKLADGVVGKACSAASDCGSGSCMQTIPIVNTSYPGGYCTGRCFRDEECGAGGVCVPGLLGAAGSCYLGCDQDVGCPREGYLCRVVSGVGRCIAAPPPLPDHVAGNACDSDTDCGGGAMSCVAMLGANVAPGGYCSQACAISEDCGAGGVCINGIGIVTISSGRCLKSCTTGSECREGYECALFGGPSSSGPGACTPLVASEDAGVN